MSPHKNSLIIFYFALKHLSYLQERHLTMNVNTSCSMLLAWMMFTAGFGFEAGWNQALFYEGLHRPKCITSFTEITPGTSAMSGNG